MRSLRLLVVTLLAASPAALALGAQTHAPHGLAADTPVLGVTGDEDGMPVAFLDVLVARRGLVHDTVDARALIVVNATEGPRAYWTDGRAFRLESGVLVDEDGGEWDPATGEGPAGARLDGPAQERATWAGWSDAHPGSRVHALLLASLTLPATPDDAARVRFSEPVNRTAVEAFVPVGVRVTWEDARTLKLATDAARGRFTIPPGAYGAHGGVLQHPLAVALGPESDALAQAPVPREDGPGGILALGAGGAGALVLFAWLARRSRRS